MNMHKGAPIININIILQNMLNLPVLFFFLGILAVSLNSELTVPQPLPKLFSLYLLIAISLHGGDELFYDNNILGIRI
ncbi:MAG: sodium-dependent bicarbonate transport family permease [Sulfurimonas sp.]|nr:sodium-dependent bicarbonate transport family permease [Sulfurimonas sp.]